MEELDQVFIALNGVLAGNLGALSICESMRFLKEAARKLYDKNPLQFTEVNLLVLQDYNYIQLADQWKVSATKTIPLQHFLDHSCLSPSERDDFMIRLGDKKIFHIDRTKGIRKIKLKADKYWYYECVRINFENEETESYCMNMIYTNKPELFLKRRTKLILDDFIKGTIEPVKIQILLSEFQEHQIRETIELFKQDDRYSYIYDLIMGRQDLVSKFGYNRNKSAYK